MNQASKLISGSTDGLLNAKSKKQLTWVVIVTVCLLVAVRGGQMVGSMLRGDSAQPDNALVDTAEPAADGVPAQVAVIVMDQGSPENQQSPATAIVDQPDAEQSATPSPAEQRERFEVLVVESTERSDDPGRDEAQTSPATEATNSTPADQPVTVGEQDGQSNDVPRRVLAALAAARSRDAADNCPAKRDELLRALFAASGAAPVAGEQDSIPEADDSAANATSQDVSQESVVPPSVKSRLAVLFANDITPSDEQAVIAAPVSSRIVTTWQELLIRPRHEAAEAVEQTLAQPEDPPAARQSIIGEYRGTSADESKDVSNQANPPEDTSPADRQGNEGQTGAALNDDARQGSSSDTKELVLMNPPNGGGTIGYLVNGHTFTMPAGHSQRLPAGREWHIHFHRGGDFDDVEMVLRSGTYEFRASEAGWQLWAIDGAPANR